MASRVRIAMTAIAAICVAGAALWIGHGEVESSDPRLNPAMDSRTKDAAVADDREHNQGSESRDAVSPPIGERATVTGRVVDGDGNPVAGAAVTWTLDDGEVETVKSMTGGDGRFEIVVERGRRSDTRIDIDAVGFALKYWSLCYSDAEGLLTSIRRIDLGDFELTRSGTIIGRVVNRHGDPAARVYIVICHSKGQGLPIKLDTDSNCFDGVECSTDPLTGEFRLERVPEGLRAVFLNLPKIYDSTEVFVRTVVVNAEATHVVTIETGGPVRPDTILVKPTFFSKYTYIPPERFHLTGSNGVAHSATEFRNDFVLFSGLEADDYELVMDDSRYLTERRYQLRPSDERVDIELRGPSAVKVEIVDAESGLAVKEFDLTLKTRDGVLAGWRRGPLSNGNQLDAGGVIGSLPAGALSLIVNAEGFAETEACIAGLQPDETRDVTIRLGRKNPRSPPAVKGIVVQSDGVTPAERCLVWLVRRAIPAEMESGAVAAIGCQMTCCDWTDEAGVFSIQEANAGTYSLLAEGRGTCATTSSIFEISESAGPIQVKLTSPPARGLRGVLTLPKGYPAAGNRLTFEAAVQIPLDESTTFSYSLRATAITGVDGSFFVKWLRPGLHRIVLEPVCGGRVNMLSQSTYREIFLDSVEIKDRDIDNFSLVPSQDLFVKVHLTIRAGGVPLSYAVVRLESIDGAFQEEGVCDSGGRVTFGPVPPGPTELLVNNLEDGWSYQAAHRIQCAAPEVSELIDIPLTTCRFTILDAEQSPLVNKSISVMSSFGAGCPWVLENARKTNRFGEITLRLPATEGCMKISLGGARADLEFDTWPPTQKTIVVE